jgi:hypothetical protein
MKKLLKAEKNGSAYTITFDPVQQAEHKAMRGRGFKPRVRLDTRERAMSSVEEQPAQQYRDMEGDYMEGDDMEGEGFKDFMKKIKRAKIGKKIVKYAKDNKILKRVGDAVVERAIKTIA